jgi:ssDNA-binding Zn-finger/Zn-ribbon topoisomerase 1
MPELSPEERARRLAALDAYIAREKGKPSRKRKISSAGVKTESGVACPKCGGGQFKARRSTAGRLGIVATGLLAVPLTRQKQVQCVTCGTKYARG